MVPPSKRTRSSNSRENKSLAATTNKNSVATATRNSTADIDSTQQRLDHLMNQLAVKNEGKKGEASTKAGWCLKQGLRHISQADNGSLSERIVFHGVPSFYLKDGGEHCRHNATQDLKDPQTCFQSLCRIVAGQFVSGHSAQAAWKRVLALAKEGEELSPDTILNYVEERDLERFQKAAGLTQAKARSLLDLAEHYGDGRLQESWLQSSSEEDVRETLLKVRGIGEWSCDMFLMFYLERPNVLPLGDLGVRKGLAQHFNIKGAGKQQQLCPKKDATRIRDLLEPFQPYWSLLSYYMWRVADTPDMGMPEEFTNEEGDNKKKRAKKAAPLPATPAARTVTRVVTP